MAAMKSPRISSTAERLIRLEDAVQHQTQTFRDHAAQDTQAFKELSGTLIELKLKQERTTTTIWACGVFVSFMVPIILFFLNKAF
jgi:hypothetical protein